MNIKTISVLPLLLSLAACSPNSNIDRATQHTAKQEQEALTKASPVTLNKDEPVKVEDKPQSWEAWSYHADEMPMGGMMKFAFIDSSNVLQFKFPYHGPQRGRLVLRETNGKVETLMLIERGQILCNSWSPCNVNIRLDDEPTRQYEAVGPADHSSQSIFIESDALPEKIAQAKKVRIQFTVFQEGDPILEFNTSNFNPEAWLGQETANPIHH